MKRFDCFKRKVSGNGRPIKNARDKNMIVGYFLKANMRHYFESVDHEILTNILGKRLADQRVLLLIRKVLDNHESKIHGRGMPISNLTSQLFANIYLNELDYFVKHKLRAKYYIRYLDDFVILHNNKTVLLHRKRKINEFLNTIKLGLHPEKTKIYALHSGANILGFRVFYNYKLPYRRNIRRFNKRLENLLSEYENGEISEEYVLNRINGWFAYAMWGNTRKLRKRLAREY